MTVRREDGSAVAEKRSEEEHAEEKRSEENGAFDPGLETGYLRRAPRDHELDVEQGAAPFEAGPGAGYDGKRAKRAQKRREKAEKRLQEQRERAEQERLANERAEALKTMHEREQRERDRAERERLRLERARELHEQNLRAQEERLEQRRQERARLQEERRQQAEERRERERAEREQREKERKERARALKEQERERRAERERQEREEKLRRKREESLKQERERAERMHARRREMVEQAVEAPAQGEAPQVKEIGAEEEGPAPQVVPAPQAEKAAPAAIRPVPRHSLKLPTLKVALTLAALSAAAFGAGTLLGLPMPDLSSESTGSKASSLTGALALDSGTPASLTKGPFHPVLGNVDYGEKDAKFGAPRSGHMHAGQDMFAKTGTPLMSVRDGVVVDRGKVNGPYSGGRGNYLAIYSPLDDVSFVYFHMLKPAPAFVGDEVRAGQQIGQLGCTGTCFGPHLHFEVRQGKATLRADTKAVDPLPYLRQWPQAVPAKP